MRYALIIDSSFAKRILECLVVLLYFFDEDAFHVIAVLAQLCRLLVILFHTVNVLLEMRLCYLGVDHKQVYHGQYLEEHLLLKVDVADRLEGKVSLLPLGLAG